MYIWLVWSLIWYQSYVQYTSMFKDKTFKFTTEGFDTSKILYKVSKIDREKVLRILRVLEDSGDSLGIPEDSWGFVGIPNDS